MDQENQDLGHLVQFCQEFDLSTGAEHPVQVVVKCPFMAMRYPKTTNTVCGIHITVFVVSLYLNIFLLGPTTSSEVSQKLRLRQSLECNARNWTSHHRERTSCPAVNSSNSVTSTIHIKRRDCHLIVQTSIRKFAFYSCH
jgi:hypothetical protein